MKEHNNIIKPFDIRRKKETEKWNYTVFAERKFM